MSERDFTNDPDDPNNPYGQNRRPDVYSTSSPNSDGYGNPTDGMGSPRSGYGPGGVNNPAYQNYNGGVAPGAPSPRYDYNGGAPPSQALTAGHGWEWEGPQTPSWNEGLGQWDRGVWQERAGKGLGYAAPAAPPPQGPGPGPGPKQPPSFQPPQGAAPGAPQAAPASVKTPPITDEVTKMLMARLNELKNPQDLNSDPNYQNAVRAYQVASLRGADRQRKALAERSAAGGTRSTGGFNVGVRGIMEKQGENAAQYTSGLAMDRLRDRESQLVEAIRMARAVGQDDIANQLEVQRLSLQQELGRGDLSLRSELGRGQLGLGYDQLGFSYADMVRRANSEAYQSGLRG